MTIDSEKHHSYPVVLAEEIDDEVNVGGKSTKRSNSRDRSCKKSFDRVSRERDIVSLKKSTSNKMLADKTNTPSQKRQSAGQASHHNYPVHHHHNNTIKESCVACMEKKRRQMEARQSRDSAMEVLSSGSKEHVPSSLQTSNFSLLDELVKKANRKVNQSNQSTNRASSKHHSRETA